MKHLFKQLTIVTLAISLFTACTDEDDSNSELTTSGGYTLALQVFGTNDESADYVVQSESLMEGTISATGQGLEQTGWRYFVQVNKSLFSVGYFADNNCIGYQMNEDGQVEEYGRFVFEKTLDCFGIADDNTLLAMEVPRSGDYERIIHVIDVDDVSITKKVNTKIYKPEGDTLVKWPTAMAVQGDKLFISFYPLSQSGDFSTPSVDTAQVAIFSYPELEFEKVINDTRTSPIGIYGSASGIIEAESGDLYTFSSSSIAGGYSQKTKPSGILRIKHGTTEFDQDYFFNIEEATEGGKIVFFAPVGGNKAIARIVTDDSQLWGAFSPNNPICKLVIIDLEAKTVTDVKNVPMHGAQYATQIYMESGKAYMSITTATDAHVYAIDPATATATQGAIVEGLEAKGIYNLN